MRNLVIKIKLSKKLEGTMSENEKDDDIFSEKEKQVEIDPNPLAATLDELNDLLEKEKQKSLRLQADYQNLEKQTIDRINTHGDKIILDFLTVYEDEGKKLNPKLHEVVQEIEDNDHEEGTIVKEITKGYIIRDEVMKYSKVCVSKKIIKE